MPVLCATAEHGRHTDLFRFEWRPGPMAEWRKNAIHTLNITGYTAEGLGVARLDGRVVFVPGTIQGECWEVQLLKVKPNIAWGRGVRLLTPSPERLNVDCPLAGRCGGCQYRHMSYLEEL